MNEWHHLVADTRPTKLPEVAQVLADLGIGKAERLGEFAAGNGRDAIGLKRFEWAQIQAEPSDYGAGNMGGETHFSPVALVEKKRLNCRDWISFGITIPYTALRIQIRDLAGTRIG